MKSPLAKLPREMFHLRRKTKFIEEPKIQSINMSAPDFARTRHEIASEQIGLVYGAGPISTVSYSGHVWLSNYVCVTGLTPDSLD